VAMYSTSLQSPCLDVCCGNQPHLVVSSYHPVKQWPASLLQVQGLERVGETGWPCGNRGLCSLVSGTCGCYEGYMGDDCGECTQGFVRVDEHCVPHFVVVVVPWWHTWHWLWLLLLLLLCCCCCRAWVCHRRRKQAVEFQEHYDRALLIEPVLEDSHLFIAMKLAPRFRDVLIQRERLLRPDILMKGDLARRASICGIVELPDDAKRMRQLTTGCSVWPGRRCASIDGCVHSRIVEMYSDGRPRQCAVLAYTDDCSGAAPRKHYCSFGLKRWKVSQAACQICVMQDDWQHGGL
jgi:hypothetical protein